MSESTPESPNPSDISRRHMLSRIAQTAGAAAVAVVAGRWIFDDVGDAGLHQPEPAKLKNYFERIELPASSPRLSVAHGPTEQVYEMMRAAINGLDKELGIKRFISKGDRVLIKPNVGFERAPQLGATTNPEALRALIRLVRDAGPSRIIVADNPIEQAAACFAKTKIQEVAEAEGAEVMLPAEVHFKSVEIRNRLPNPDAHEALGRWPIFWKPLEDADKVIGIAPVKDHNLCNASMCMKNWYGLLGGRRNQFHQAIHDIVSDLGYMMSPTMVINDGTLIMTKNGPTGGRLDDVREGNTIVAGIDPIACDAWCCENLLERDPAQLTYLDYANDKFGGQDFNETKRLGQRDWADYQRRGLIAEVTI